MTHKDLFPRCYAESRWVHVYDNRQSFVSDVCQGVSTLLKEKRELLKKGRVYSTLYHHSFEIRKKNPETGGMDIVEEWDIQLTLMEDIEVVKCVQRDYEHKTKTVYFGEELKKSRNDTKYNRLENVTALREFLKRECLGIGKTEEPKETLTKDSMLFNFILMTQEQWEFDGLKDKGLKKLICSEIGMTPKLYDQLVKEYWGD